MTLSDNPPTQLLAMLPLWSETSAKAPKLLCMHYQLGQNHCWVPAHRPFKTPECGREPARRETAVVGVGLGTDPVLLDKCVPHWERNQTPGLEFQRITDQPQSNAPKDHLKRFSMTSLTPRWPCQLHMQTHTHANTHARTHTHAHPPPPPQHTRTESREHAYERIENRYGRNVTNYVLSIICIQTKVKLFRGLLVVLTAASQSLSCEVNGLTRPHRRSENIRRPYGLTLQHGESSFDRCQPLTQL